MKRSRLIIFPLLLAAAFGLSACSMIPSAVEVLDDLRQGAQPTPQVQVETAVPAPIPPETAIITTDLEEALQRVYAEANPSVVNIRVSRSAASIGGFQLPGMPFDFGPYAEEDPDLPVVRGLGSGFVWDADGHIVTNNHVVAGAGSVTVIFSDGLSLPAEVVGQDPDSDLAVVKVDPDEVELRPLTLGDSTQVKVGQFTVAIGNPYGLAGTMTFGIISALGRTLDTDSATMQDAASYIIPDIIQTDAPVNPGNSGGVLLDLEGRLIGVPTAIESADSSSAGIGFAVPSVIVRKVVPVLIEQGAFEHPFIGITGVTLTSELAAEMDLPASQRGVLVIEVSQDSPADEAGLRGSTRQVEVEGQEAQVGGDVITAIAGRPVQDFEDLTTFLACSGQVGQDVVLTLLRDGDEAQATLVLAARPAQSTARVESEPETRTTPRAWLGVNGVTLTPEMAEVMDLDAGQAGALVVSVVRRSPADEAGIRGSDRVVTLDGERAPVGGDVITAVDGREVESMATLTGSIAEREPDDEVTLTLLRDGERLRVRVVLGERP